MIVQFYNGLQNCDTGECCKEGNIVSYVKYITDRNNIATIYDVRITDISETDCVLSFKTHNTQRHVRVNLNNIVDFLL